MSGETQATYEIWEVILSVSLFVVLVGTILVLNDPDFVKGKTLVSEISYVSSIVSDTNTKVKIKLPENTKVDVNGNDINLKINNIEIQKEFIGNDVNFEQEKEVLIIN
ncbi:MAG: hypothetical protein KC589_02330 [Nanoarchaeota archaeon]|nr:hypothetical protein [Nanoarchaeota archaeon]